MARVSLAAAARENVQVRLFMAAASVAMAVEQHLQRIFDVTDEEEGRSWLDVVQTISANGVDHFKTLGVTNTAGYVDYAKGQIENYAATFKTENPRLKARLLEMAGDLTVRSAHQVGRHLEALHERGMSHAEKCVRSWGAAAATARLERMSRCGIAFEEPRESDVIFTFYDSNRHEIAVVIGSDTGSLLSWLSLEFYFLHEYLSHVFPAWDDPAGTFSEGYLWSLARWSFLRQSQSVVNPALADVGWQKHRARHLGRAGADYYLSVEHRAAWFREQSDQQGSFPAILLDWAATSDAPPRFHERLLAMLRRVWKRGDASMAREAVFGGEASARRVHDELRRRLHSPGRRG